MSADREMDHLENMSGMNGSRHWNQPYCYAEVEDPENESAERVAQLAASAASSFYHTNLAAQVESRIGSGDPMDQLLADSFYREKFNLKARQW